MNDQDIRDHVANAWVDAFAAEYEYWRPVGFDVKNGVLAVECQNKTWLTLLRLMAKKMAEKLNAGLPEPAVKTIRASLWRVRVLVTGSRAWDDRKAIEDALLDAWHDAVQTVSPEVGVVVVHGDCPAGADAIAKQWATDNGLSHEPHPADWSEPCPDNCLSRPHRKTSRKHGEYCPLAGHRRNQRMVDLGADLVLAFHRNNSRGTGDCIARAKTAGIPVRIFEEQHG